MAHPYIDRVLKKLGFFYVEETADTVSAGHIPSYMIAALKIDTSGQIVGGPYADLVIKASRALELYDAGKDSAVYLPAPMRDRFFVEISNETQLPLDIVFALTR